MYFDIAVYYHLYDGQVDAALQQRALALLDKDEKQRLDKFKVAHAAQQYLLGRLLAKSAIAEQLNIPAEHCRIVLSKNGKPSLADASQTHFSIAHCEGAVMVAIAQREIGIDVERVERFNKTLINNHFFSPPVINNIETLSQKKTVDPQASKLATMYWTAMEAVVKLEDSSIFSERSRFDMLLDENSAYQFARGIALVSWSASSGLVSSVAVKNPELQPLRFCYREFPGGRESALPVEAHTAELNVRP